MPEECTRSGVRHLSGAHGDSYHDAMPTSYTLSEMFAAQHRCRQARERCVSQRRRTFSRAYEEAARTVSAEMLYLHTRRKLEGVDRSAFLHSLMCSSGSSGNSSS